MSTRSKQTEVVQLRQRIRELESDVQDMHNARQTIFYRGRCGHLHEQGITCPVDICGYCKEAGCAYYGPLVGSKYCSECKMKVIANAIAGEK